MSADLLATARRLARASPSRPRQSDLKRAVSTACYALFPGLAKDAADVLVGVGNDRPDAAWAQAYRALDRGAAKTACGQVHNLRFPPGIRSVADTFVILQQSRHDADYAPNHRLTRGEALAAIELAEQALNDLRQAARRDRKALAILLLLRRR